MRLASIGISLLGAAGCGTLEHVRTTAEYAERCVSTQSASGAERLRIEAEYDGAVREVIESHGRPDYLYVVDRSRLYLFYVTQDMAAVIHRGLIPPGEVTKIDRIPGSLLTLLPRREMDRLLARRLARDAQARGMERAKRARAGNRPPPASADSWPSTRQHGWSSRSFDVDEIVERLRKPISAADAGVSGWRRDGSVDGSAIRLARSGSVQYQVLPDRVTVVAAITGRPASTPPGARLAYVRVNNAIFGARAAGVSEAVEGLVEQVLRDPSGSTKIVRRIAGRMVSVTRVPGRDLLVYSVHAD